MPTHSTKSLSWKPSLVYVPDATGKGGHLRGGDQEILPLSDVENPKLLRCLVDAFNRKPSWTSSALATACDSSGSQAEQFNSMLATLIAQGCIIESDVFDYNNKLHRFLIQQDLYSDTLVEKIQATPVYIWSRHPDAVRIVSLAQAYGFNATCGEQAPESKPDIIIAFGSFVSDPLFQQINIHALQHRQPWILLRQSGMDLAQIGPLFTPFTTGCYGCLQQRMLGQREHGNYYHDFQQQNYDELVNLWLESDFSTCVERVLREIVFFVVHPFALSLVGQSVYRNLMTQAEQREMLLKLPYCPSCGLDQAENNMSLAPVALV